MFVVVKEWENETAKNISNWRSRGGCFCSFIAISVLIWRILWNAQKCGAHFHLHCTCAFNTFFHDLHYQPIKLEILLDIYSVIKPWLLFVYKLLCFSKAGNHNVIWQNILYRWNIGNPNIICFWNKTCKNNNKPLASLSMNVRTHNTATIQQKAIFCTFTAHQWCLWKNRSLAGKKNATYCMFKVNRVLT